ncbi:hypothetical protein FOL47_004425 [Perkinsus chesapeaki]|uniref:Uncharacterized protein n=1 Tax=Perkinsus chesapeaki TaxID=330153 RepID=A0A7J6M2X7_PERCH|nr:hypothetical protein FOL47_004425 [Perkinsus chesapeaki]
MQQRQQQQHQQLSNIDSKINTGLKSGDLILASINNGYSYTLVQVLDCHKLVDNSPQQQQEQEGVPKSEVPGIKDDEHGDDGDNTALCAHNPSSTYTLTLSYSPDKEIMKVMEEEDVEAGSVLSNTLIGDTGGVEEEEEQEKEGKYKLESKGRERFRKGDKVYALSPGTKGQQFHLAIVAATDDDNNDMPSAAAGGKGDRTSTDNTNFVSVTFSKRGTGKVEKVPRSMVFHRSSIPSTRQPPCISGNSSSSRNLKRGRDSNNEDTSSLAIENIEPASKSQKISDPKHEAAAAHSPKSAATAPPPPASSIITHRVPLLEELGLYDGDEEGNDKEKCNENDDDVMAESEWKVIERSIRILNKFGIDALVSSDKREVFPISDIIINEDGQKVNGNNAHGQAKESSSLRKWIEQVSPWPHKQESKDFDILRKLSGVETHECSSFWVVTKSEEEAKKDE